MMDPRFIETLWLTLKLASMATAILFVIGLPVAYLLAYAKVPFKPFVEALVSMPLVLPPSVLGYYLLLASSPHSWFGRGVERYLNIRLAFSFEGILIASVLFGLPFMIQPIQSGLRSLPGSLREASYTLGKSATTTFVRVLLPNIKPSLFTALALTFAHCIGEFGVVLMVGGSIPGVTRVASIALYDEVQAMNFDKANEYAIVLFVLSFVLLTLIYAFQRKQERWRLMS